MRGEPFAGVADRQKSLGRHAGHLHAAAEGMRKAASRSITSCWIGNLSQCRNNKGDSREPVHHRRHGPRCQHAGHQSLPDHPCPINVAGFTCDEERLHRSWRESTDEAQRSHRADQIQERAY